MADNVYALLQQAWAVAKSGDSNMFGVEVAIVTNVQDPDQLGRVKICFPRLPGKPESDWARVAQPAAGDGRGFYWLPEVSDEVLVAFERGQANRPFVIGALWNGKDKPMKDAYTADNTTRMIQTKSGHQIVFDDKAGDEKMTFADGSGKRTLTFDVKNKKFLIEVKEGDVEIHAEKKLTLECEDLEIKTSKTGKFQIGTTFDLKVADKASFKAGPKMELKASEVNLNPPSLSIAALVTAAMQAAAAAAAAATAAAQQQAAAAAAGAAPPGPATVPTSTPAAAGGATAAAGAARGGGTGAAAAQQTAGAAPPAGTAWTTAPSGSAGPSGTAAASAAPPPSPTTVTQVQPQTRRARLKGLHFETGKTFLQPSAMAGIRQLVKLFESFNGLVGLVNGHTDKQGAGGVDGSGDPAAVEFNRGLSEERADAIKAFLLDDVDAWMQWYAGKPSSRQWGVREDQLMLATLRDEADARFYGAAIDGEAGPLTKDAVLRFQQSSKADRSARGLSPLAEDGVSGDETRHELVRAYLAVEGTSLKAGSTLETHGCGMSHPLRETEGDPNPDQPLNRRVEVFLFEGQIDPKPQPSCPSGGCVEYQKWVDQKILDVELDQPPGAATVKVVDEQGAAVAGAQVHLAGPLAVDGDTKDDGVASFTELFPGDYTARAKGKDLSSADEKVTVASGSRGEVTLTLKPGDSTVATFKLLDSDGKPVSGATAVVLVGDEHREFEADADGVVKIPLKSGEEAQLVEVRAPGPLRVLSTELA